MRIFPLVTVFLVLLLSGCGSDRSKTGGDQLDQGPQEPVAAADSITILTLPTPMQVPALLRNHDIDYLRDIVLPPLRAEQPFFIENILLGMKLIDLSYVSVFNDRQEARRQMDEVKDLTARLGIATDPNERLINRFNNNLQNQDSLGRIILEFYELGHLYFSHQGREGVGLLIVMGCYFEGMYFTFRHVRDVNPRLFAHLLHQQWLYAENLHTVLDQYQFPSDINVTIERFRHIHKNMETVRIYLKSHPNVVRFPEHVEHLLNEVQADVYWIRGELSEGG